VVLPVRKAIPLVTVISPERRAVQPLSLYWQFQAINGGKDAGATKTTRGPGVALRRFVPGSFPAPVLHASQRLPCCPGVSPH